MRDVRVRMPPGVLLIVSVGAHPGVPKASDGAVGPHVMRVVVVVSEEREGGKEGGSKI